LRDPSAVNKCICDSRLVSRNNAAATYPFAGSFPAGVSPVGERLVRLRGERCMEVPQPQLPEISGAWGNLPVLADVVDQLPFSGET